MRILVVLLLPIALATHYEDPKDGCGSDEEAVRIQGVTGDFCSPKCSGSTCPTDPPSASDATPRCALRSSTGEKRCALICDPSGNSACPKGASCQSIQGTGICTYPSAMASPEIATLSLSSALATARTPNYEKEWKNFKESFGKIFVGAEEEAHRFEIFKSNLDTIDHWNAKNLSFQLGVNEFAHLSPDEFAASHLGLKKPEKPWGDMPRLGTHVYSGAPLADSVDWTSKGAVTEVKNQAACGSCWAFSTTGSLEGAWEIKSGHLVSLSEQQFVDCDKVDSGCGGGLMDHGFAFAEKNAICTEASYAYHARKGQCKSSSCTVGIPLGGVTGYKDVAEDSEQALMEALQQQPVSIAIEADKSVFQLYKTGVLSGSCGSKLDHGVLAVGYGMLDGKNYWKVKNSWGKTWGMNGYGMLLRGKGGAGECGILSGPPSYPVVTGKPGPSPGPTPPPSPTPPPPPGTSHYEKPPCQSGEVEAEVQGAGGNVCAPPCDNGSCPTDVPAGTKAKPQCMLQDSSSGKKYCALECIMPGSCPPSAKCARIGGIIGVCVYPTSQKKPSTLLAAVPADSGVINI